MSKFLTNALAELLVLKKMTIDQYFENLSHKERKLFWADHRELLAKNARHFTGDRLALLVQFIEDDPDSFMYTILKQRIKIGIATAPSAGWANTTRVRQLKPFHYDYPELTIFKSAVDVKSWFECAPETLSYTSLKHMLTEVVPHHSKNPVGAFGSAIRGVLQPYLIPHLTEYDFDVLYSDGDTLLNELFSEVAFKECVKHNLFPSEKFVHVLELNCTLAALEKSRSTRHHNRVAKNLKRAKLLLEIGKLNT